MEHLHPLGTAAIIVALFFFGAVLMFFVGLLGEYVLCINTRVMKRPLVVVEKDSILIIPRNNNGVGVKYK